jgi:hypothetical protein
MIYPRDSFLSAKKTIKRLTGVPSSVSDPDSLIPDPDLS